MSQPPQEEGPEIGRQEAGAALQAGTEETPANCSQTLNKHAGRTIKRLYGGEVRRDSMGHA